MTKEKTITISESEYDELIQESIREQESLNCKDIMIKTFVLDALIIREKLFYD